MAFYSPAAHAAEFERMRQKLAAIAHPASAARFANLANFIDPSAARAGIGVPFDVPARDAMRDRIKYLPDLT